MSDNVIKLKGELSVHGDEATAKIVAWLRNEADSIERGDVLPVHKAVLVVHTEADGKVNTKVSYSNANILERTGMLTLALHDVANDYATD